jgi:hypothetical protein
VQKLRTIVRANSIKECEKRVAVKKREGWQPVNDMKPKLDDSHMSWGEISYVVVMEKDGTEGRKEHRFNRMFPQR